MVSMKGEWRVLTPTEGPMVLEGGHAINIVGYTDGYRDDRGNVGGFIVRNTWADGIGKGPRARNASGAISACDASRNSFGATL